MGELVAVKTVIVVSFGEQPKAKIKIICDRKRAGLQIRESIFAIIILSPLVRELLNFILEIDE